MKLQFLIQKTNYREKGIQPGILSQMKRSLLSHRERVEDPPDMSHNNMYNLVIVDIVTNSLT